MTESRFGWHVCSKQVLMYSSSYDPTHVSGKYPYCFKDIVSRWFSCAHSLKRLCRHVGQHCWQNAIRPHTPGSGRVGDRLRSNSSLSVYIYIYKMCIIYIYKMCIIYIYTTYFIMYIYMGVDLNSFFSKRPFLAKKKLL